MNIRQLDNIVSWLLSKFKSAPYRWNEQQIHQFCEMVGLQWSISIVTIQSVPKQRSHNYQEQSSQQNKGQIPLLDICTRQYEEILELCNAQSLYKLFSHTVDINLYYQIQKLKIWSLIVLKYQHYREILKKHYGSKLFSQQKCKSCTAEISCACSILTNLLYEIEIYIKSIYEATPIIQNQNRRHSMFISSDIINLLLKSLSHLPQYDLSPLFWDMDDIKVLLYVIKFQDYFSLLFQNQIDGFVLLLLVNPPFKEDNLFLKCLLMSQESSNIKNQNQLFRNRQSMTRNTMQTASKYHQINQFVYLLHYLLQILSFTAFKSQEQYTEYKNIGQRKVSELQWISLYYFTKVSQIGNNKKQSDIYRRQFKSFGNVEMEQIKQRNKTETIDQIQLKIPIDCEYEQVKKQFSQPNVTHSASISPIMQKDNNWIKFKNYNVSQFIMNEEETIKNNNRQGSVIMHDNDSGEDQLRDRDNTETHVQLEEEIQSGGNVSQSQEEQSQHLSQQLSNQEEENQDFNNDNKMQESVMMQSIMIQQQPITQQVENQMQESVFMGQSTIIQQPPVLQQSTIMQQSTLLQQSIYMQQSTMLQQSELMDKSIHLNQIIQDNIETQRIQQKRSIKEQILERIEKLTLQLIFDPFQLTFPTHLKLKCDEQQKLKIVNICGASFGRSEENTFAFTDHSKISSKHCQILYKDKSFYLIDTGSKGGTFIKINHNFVIEKDMSVYIGNRFAFKIVDINTDTGFLEVRYEHEGTAKHKQIQLKKGDKFLIGRERSKNNFTFMHSQCNRLMSAKHMEINYEYNFKAGSVKLMINDLDSKNGTWLRLSEKQISSSPFHLQKGSKFNLSFELMFEVMEMVCDV